MPNETAENRIERLLDRGCAYAVIGLLVALVYRTSRTFGLLGDTRFLIEENEWMRDSSML